MFIAESILVRHRRATQSWLQRREGRRTEFFVFFVSLVYTTPMRALFKKADERGSQFTPTHIHRLLKAS